MPMFDNRVDKTVYCSIFTILGRSQNMLVQGKMFNIEGSLNYNLSSVYKICEEKVNNNTFKSFIDKSLDYI